MSSSALIPSNGVNRAVSAAFHSSYAAQCGSSMLEFTSTDFGYELSVAANYAARSNLVGCYPEAGNENAFSLASWAAGEQPPAAAVYPYPGLGGCELSGLFGANSATCSVARQMHHARLAHHHGGAGSGPGLHHHHQPSGKTKPRRRVATIAQRRAANIRERRRMFNLNEAFGVLRKKVPTFAYEKRLSRIETLRLAITYIAFMTEVLNGKYPRDDALFSPDAADNNNTPGGNNNNNNGGGNRGAHHHHHHHLEAGNNTGWHPHHHHHHAGLGPPPPMPHPCRTHGSP